jgi:hypothetical protein
MLQMPAFPQPLAAAAPEPFYAPGPNQPGQALAAQQHALVKPPSQQLANTQALRKNKQAEFHEELQKQIEEQKSRKAVEQQRRLHEEAQEEERLKREREEIEARYHDEKDAKKKKVQAIRDANKDMMSNAMSNKVQNSPVITAKKQERSLPAQPPAPVPLAVPYEGNDLFGPGIINPH